MVTATVEFTAQAAVSLLDVAAMEEGARGGEADPLIHGGAGALVEISTKVTPFFKRAALRLK